MLMSEVENDPEKLKKLLVEQIYSSVRWREFNKYVIK